MMLENKNTIKKLCIIISTAIICTVIITYKHYVLPNIKAHFESRKSIASERVKKKTQPVKSQETKQESTVVETKHEKIEPSDNSNNAYKEEVVINENDIKIIQREEQRQQRLAEKQAKKQEKQELKEQRQQAKAEKKAEKQRLREERRQQRAERRNRNKDNGDINSDNLSEENKTNVEE